MNLSCQTYFDWAAYLFEAHYALMIARVLLANFR